MRCKGTKILADHPVPEFEFQGILKLNSATDEGLKRLLFINLMHL